MQRRGRQIEVGIGAHTQQGFVDRKETGSENWIWPRAYEVRGMKGQNEWEREGLGGEITHWVMMYAKSLWGC
jgi:hypothetical protein